MPTQLVRFGIVGTVSLVVTLSAFAGLTALGLHHSPAAAAAWLLTLAVNFTLSRSWTFSDRAVNDQRELKRYLVLGLGAAGANAGLIALLVDGLGLATPVGAVTTVAMITPVTFLASRYWVFPGPERQTKTV